MRTMSLFRFFMLVPLGVALLGATSGWAAELAGTWNGSGYVNPKDGKREKVRCRITYNRHTPKVFSVSAVCASPSAKVNQTGEVLMVNPNLFVGDFYNPEFDVSGRVRVRLSGSRQTVTFSGPRGSGSVSLSK